MSPEIPDVVTGEVIDADLWGNPIRDRTIQRYDDAADRAALNPAPVEGDQSYLRDTKAVVAYDGASWGARFGADVGAVTAPSFQFADHPGVGMFAVSSQIIGFTVNSATAAPIEISDSWVRVRGSNSPELVPDAGTNDPTNPGFSFNGESGIGMYRLAPGIVGLAAGGVEGMRISATQTRIPTVFSNQVAGTANVWVTSTGELRNTASLMATKKDIVPLVDPFDVIRELNPFSWLPVTPDPDENSDRRYAGFGAEEVWAVIPEAKAPAFYDVNAIVAYLVAAVQKLIPVQV
jgi:hypothetical protein